MQKAVNFNDLAIVSVKGSDYRINFRYMNKDDAINIMMFILQFAFPEN